MPDEEKILSEQNRAKLDGIVQQMIANKESDEDILFVVNDFKSKYGEVKKKDNGQPDGSESQSSIDYGDAPDLTEPIKTATKVAPVKESPIAYDKSAVLLMKSGQGKEVPKTASPFEAELEYHLGANELKDLQAAKQAESEAQEALKVHLENNPPSSSMYKNPVESEIKQRLFNAQESINKLETTAKFRDKDRYYQYYDTQTFEPIAIPKAEAKEYLQNFMDEEFGNRRDIVNRKIQANEFVGKQFDELDESAKEVVLTAFNERYIPAEQLQTYLKSNNLDLDMNKTPHALNQFVKGVVGTSAAVLDGAAYKNSAADVMNANYVKAKNGMISKSEYERKFSELASDIESNIKDGVYITDKKLPGVTAITQDWKGESSDLYYTYTEDQVRRWLAKSPTYDEIKAGAETPYVYDDGTLGNWAEDLNKYADSLKSNPLYKDSLIATKIPQGLGSSLPFIATTVLGSMTGVPAGAITAVTGALANASQTYDEAVKGGATSSEAVKAYTLGLGVGATEAIPLERLMNRFGAATGWNKKAIELLVQGTEEAVQEGGTSLSNDAIAKLLYDTSREIGSTFKSDASVGFITGMIMGAGKAISSSKESTPEQKKLAEDAMSWARAASQQTLSAQTAPEAKTETPVKSAEKPVEQPEVKVEEVVAEEPTVEPEPPKAVETVEETVAEEPKAEAKEEVAPEAQTKEETTPETTTVDSKQESEPRRRAEDFSNENESYRVVVGDEAFNDIVNSGVVRTNAESKNKNTQGIDLSNRPTAYPSFSRGAAAMDYAANNPNHYIIVSEDASIQPSKAGRHGKGTTMFPTDENGNHLKELSGEKVKVYKHIGGGEYILVYANGKQVTTAETEVTPTAEVTAVEDVTPEKPNLSEKVEVEPEPVSPKTALQKEIEEKKRKLAETKLEVQPINNLSLNKEDKTPILKNGAFRKAIGKIQRQKDPRGNYYKEVPIVIDDDGKIQHIGGDIPAPIQAKIDSGEYGVDNAKVVLSKKTLEPIKITRESRWKNQTPPINAANQLKRKVMENSPADAQDAVIQHFVSGGTISDVALQELFGVAGNEQKSAKKVKPERDARKSLVSSKNKQGIEKIAETIHENLTEADQERISLSDIRTEVEDAILSHNTRQEMADTFLKKHKMDRASEEQRAAIEERENRLADELEQHEKADRDYLENNRDIILAAEQADEALAETHREVIDGLRAKYKDADGNLDMEKLSEDPEAIKLLEALPTDYIEEALKSTENDKDSTTEGTRTDREVPDTQETPDGEESEGGKSIEEKIADKKKEIADLKNKLNNIGIIDDSNEVRAKLMAAYTDLAFSYIQYGIKNAVEFARELGEELTDLIQEAWDKAVEENLPKQEEPKPVRTEKKALLNRAYEGDNILQIKAAINELGLRYEVQSWDEAKRLANEFIAQVGLKNAITALRNNELAGAPAAFVWKAAVDEVADRIAETTDEAKIAELSAQEAELLKMFDEKAREAGRFISALQEVYADSVFNYSYERQKQKFEEINGGYISPEMEAKYKALDIKYRDVVAKLQEAERRAKEAELQGDVDAIAESVLREKVGGVPSNLTSEQVREAIRAGVKSEIDKMFAKMPTQRRVKAEKAIKKLEEWQKSLRGKTYDATIGVPVAILDAGITVIKTAIKAGVSIADAVELGIKEITEKHGRKWDWDTFRNDVTELFADSGLDTETRSEAKAERKEDGRLKIPNSLIRNLVEQGITDANELTQAVLEIVQQTVPDATEREVRDAISGYGKTVNLSQDEIDKQTRRLKRALRDISILEDIAEKKRPLRSGLQRDELTVEERARQKQIKEALKDLPIDEQTLAKEQKTALDVIERRLSNQIEDLQREIAEGERAVKEKKAVEYPPHILALIAERDRLKALHEQVFGRPGMSDEQKLKIAINAVRENIQDLKDKIRTGNVLPTPKQKGVTSTELETLRDEQKQLRDIITQMRKSMRIRKSPEQIRQEKKLKSVEKKIADLERRLKTGDTSTKPKQDPATNAEIEKALDKLRPLQEAYKAMEEAAGKAEQKRLELSKKAVKRRIAELQTKLAAKDYSKPKKKSIVQDKELIDLRAEKQKLQDEMDTLRYEQELRNRSFWQKVADTVLEAWNLTRGLRATAEMSFALIQGGFYFMSHPIEGIKALSVAIKHMLSESAHERFQAEIRRMPEYAYMKEDKLAITEADHKLNKKEEMFITGWTNLVWNILGLPFRLAGKNAYERWKQANIPKAMERAAVGYLNTVRINRYLNGLEMLQNQGKNRETNPEDFKNIADVVNTFTGRTSLGVLEQSSKYLAIAFFSPRMWASTMKTFTPYAMYYFGKMTTVDANGKRKVSAAQKMAMLDFIKYVGLTTSLVMLAKAGFEDDDEVEVVTDPKSSDYMKIRIGNTRVDPWGGRAQMVVFQMRFIANAMTRLNSGEVSKLGTGYTSTRWGLMGEMTNNKFSPSMQLVRKYLDEHHDAYGNTVDKYGNEVVMSEEVLNNLYPIYAETVVELWKENPSILSSFLIAYGFFGGGIQTFEEKEKPGVKPLAPVKPVQPVKPIQ